VVIMPLTIRQSGIAIALGAVALSGFAFGWWREDEGSRTASAPSADPGWTALNPVISDPAKDAAILMEREPFGAPPPLPGVPLAAAPGVATPAQPQWRIGAIVTAETSRYLVLLVRKPGEATDRTEIRHVGESLPDGGVIDTVEADRLTVQLQGAVRTIKMFAQK
jgi:hypothetical protein